MKELDFVLGYEFSNICFPVPHLQNAGIFESLVFEDCVFGAFGWRGIGLGSTRPDFVRHGHGFQKMPSQLVPCAKTVAHRVINPGSFRRFDDGGQLLREGLGPRRAA